MSPASPSDVVARLPCAFCSSRASRSASRFLPDHDVVTVRQHFGTTDVDDGPILDRIPDGEFDAFVTVDKNLRLQQNRRGRPFRIVLLRARSNALEYLAPLVPQLRVALAETAPGDLRVVGV